MAVFAIADTSHSILFCIAISNFSLFWTVGPTELPHDIVFIFQENGLHGKKCESMEYLWHFVTDVLLLAPCVWKNNGLLNSNYWKTLSAQIKVIVRIMFHNFSYISTILELISTKFWPQWWHRDLKQKSPVVCPWKCRSRSPLKKSLYFGYYTTDFNKTFTQMM